MKDRKSIILDEFDSMEREPALEEEQGDPEQAGEVQLNRHQRRRAAALARKRARERRRANACRKAQ